ncbi:Heterokaryon incompatibility protein (HET) domain containing protein [Hyaloscypha variabilis]
MSFCPACQRFGDWILSEDITSAIQKVACLERSEYESSIRSRLASIEYDQRGFPHHQSGSELKIAAQAGCPLCTLILSLILEASFDLDFENNKINPLQSQLLQEVEPGFCAPATTPSPGIHLDNETQASSINKERRSSNSSASTSSSSNKNNNDRSSSDGGTVGYLDFFVDWIFGKRYIFSSGVHGFKEYFPRLTYTVFSRYQKIPLEFYSTKPHKRNNPWISSTHLNIDPLSERSITMMKLWLQGCINGHKVCREYWKAESSRYIPARLLDVGLGRSTREVRLIETKEMVPFTTHEQALAGLQQLRYATLSHCWGNTSHFTTTKATLQQRKHGIPMDALNKTFADAVRFTRRMEVRYLWIDSLCIVQDSAEDWEQESSKMSSIYSNGIFNIAAVSAEHGDKGFLHRRPKPIRMIDIGTKAHDSNTAHQNGHLWIRPSIEIPPSYRDIQGNSPLDERAWCYQEEILAPRTFRFEKLQISFRCRVNQKYESYSRGQENNPPKTLGFFRQITEGRKVSEGHEKALDIWRDIVTEYSARHLTFSKDRLPAISGIASLMADSFDDQYLAGLWAKDMPAALCWSPGSGCGNRLEPFVAPTWSWASYSGRVKFPDICRHQAEDTVWSVSILGYNTHPVSDLYGQVKGGSLELEGDLLRLDIDEKSSLAVELRNCGTGTRFDMFMPDDNDEQVSFSECFGLLVGYRYNSEEKMNLWGPVVMVVQKIGSDEVYERIGCFESSRIGKYPGPWRGPYCSRTIRLR